ncbi:hypothetical protein F2P81_023007 [Scophthalmus maximus]|uniref:Uncharacterized protein n=1 Tax=Scophthalmus maximus TaxID=52904 RepID=A0A6A4RVG1_SCOMX|nr:hypothetical protein F2P81_023007 [Scophthalmus maximus]
MEESFDSRVLTLRATVRRRYFTFTKPNLYCNIPGYFTNISIGGRDYSFNSDGYLSNPLLDVISYTNGRGWEERRSPGPTGGPISSSVGVRVSCGRTSRSEDPPSRSSPFPPRDKLTFAFHPRRLPFCP